MRNLRTFIFHVTGPGFCFLLLLFCPVELKAQAAWEYQEEVFAFRNRQDSCLLYGAYSPLLAEDKKNYAGLSYFTVNPVFKVSATLVKTTERSNRQLIADEASGLVKFGEVHFQLNGEALKLGVFKLIEKPNLLLYQDSLIILFADATIGEGTPVVGRFLNLTAPQGKDPSVWLDFNKAYNQPCVYNMAYPCLSTPEENYLPFLVEAGEKTFLKPQGKRKVVAEVMPEFPGGIAAMMKFIANKMRVPKSVKAAGVEGTEVVSFIIYEDGSVGEAVSVSSLHPDIFEEVKRVVSKMPKWSPGTRDGIPMQVKYTVPFRIVYKK
ncbi:MAG: DUF1684 domain-containing protein [Rufibacter sp.]